MDVHDLTGIALTLYGYSLCDNLIPGIASVCRCDVESDKLVYQTTFGHVRT
jgi:hypothetical protein